MPLWRVGHGRRLTRFVLWSRFREIRQARVLKRYHQPPKSDACRGSLHQGTPWHFKNRRKTSRRADAHSVARRTVPSLGRYSDGNCGTILPAPKSSVGGAAAELAANRKISKYSELTTS